MIRLFRSVAALVLITAFTAPVAAQPLAPASAEVGVAFALRLGGEATIAGTGVTVRFDRVLDDSRCPTDVMCVWAGVLHLALMVETETTATEVLLDTMGGEGTAAGLHFALLGAKPGRLSSMGASTTIPYAVLIRADLDR